MRPDAFSTLFQGLAKNEKMERDKGRKNEERRRKRRLNKLDWMCLWHEIRVFTKAERQDGDTDRQRERDTHSWNEGNPFGLRLNE